MFILWCLSDDVIPAKAGIQKSYWGRTKSGMTFDAQSVAGQVILLGFFVISLLAMKKRHFHYSITPILHQSGNAHYSHTSSIFMRKVDFVIQM